MMSKNFCDFTKYSRIYKKTYWGNFKTGENENREEELKDIFENRNKFITDYEIKDIKNKQMRDIEKYINYLKNSYKNIDHLEIYKLKNNDYLFLNSPYVDNNYNMDGWNKIYKLYNNTAESFIKIVKLEEIKNSYPKLTQKDHLNKILLKLEENPEQKYKKCKDCGQSYYWSNHSKHLKSKMHQKITESIKKYCRDNL